MRNNRLTINGAFFYVIYDDMGLFYSCFEMKRFVSVMYTYMLEGNRNRAT